MKIKVAINQAEAFRQGIDAPAATEWVEIDPARLRKSERNLVSALLVNGNDLSRSALSRHHRAYRPVSPNERGAFGMELLQATPEALIERVRAVAAEHREVWKQYDRQMRKNANAALRHAMKAGQTLSIKIGVTADGRSFRADMATFGDGFMAADALDRRDRERDEDVAATTEIEVALCGPSSGPFQEVDYLEWASESVAERYRAFRDQVADEQHRSVKAAVEELRGGPLAEYRRAREQEQNDYEALYQRLPNALRDRREAGFADQEEITDAIHDLILRDAGIDPADTPAYIRPVDKGEVDDEAFKDLQSLCERFGVDPSEAATVGMGADCGWRQPRPDDPEGMITRDGHVWDDGRKPRLLVQVGLKRAGLDVTGFVPVADIGTGAAMFRSVRRDESVPE